MIPRGVPQGIPWGLPKFGFRTLPTPIHPGGVGFCVCGFFVFSVSKIVKFASNLAPNLSQIDPWARFVSGSGLYGGGVSVRVLARAGFCGGGSLAEQSGPRIEGNRRTVHGLFIRLQGSEMDLGAPRAWRLGVSRAPKRREVYYLTQCFHAIRAANPASPATGSDLEALEAAGRAGRGDWGSQAPSHASS